MSLFFLGQETLEQKILSMNKAVSRFIEEGDSVAMGAALEAAIPFAVGHEIWTGER
jgi:hypothetical protein